MSNLNIQNSLKKVKENSFKKNENFIALLLL